MTSHNSENTSSLLFVDVLGELGFSVSVFLLAFRGVPGKTMFERNDIFKYVKEHVQIRLPDANIT